MSASEGPGTRTVVQNGVPVALHLRKYTLEVLAGSPEAGRKIEVDRRVATIGSAVGPSPPPHSPSPLPLTYF